MTQLWNEHRPVGEQLERDELDRAHHWKTTRASMPK